MTWLQVLTSTLRSQTCYKVFQTWTFGKCFCKYSAYSRIWGIRLGVDMVLFFPLRSYQFWRIKLQHVKPWQKQTQALLKLKSSLLSWKLWDNLNLSQKRMLKERDKNSRQPHFSELQFQYTRFHLNKTVQWNRRVLLLFSLKLGTFNDCGTVIRSYSRMIRK